MYSESIHIDTNWTPAKNVTAIIIDDQPVTKFLDAINETIVYIIIKNDINIENKPKVPINLSGFVEKPIIPSKASFNIFFNGYLVSPANLSSLSYSYGVCLNPNPAP